MKLLAHKQAFLFAQGSILADPAKVNPSDLVLCRIAGRAQASQGINHLTISS